MMLETSHPWLDAYPPDIDWSQAIDPKPIYHLLNEAATRYPDHVALDFFGSISTYQTLADQVAALAGALAELGVTKGTRVGLCLPNCPACVVSYMAILRAGGVVVHISPLYGTEDMHHVLVDAQIELAITTNLQAIYPKLAAQKGKTPLKRLIVVDFSAALPQPKRTLFRVLKCRQMVRIAYDSQHIFAYETLLTHAPLQEVPALDPRHDLAVLQYTGGTTGTPKAAMLTHANIYSNVIQCGRWFGSVEEGAEQMLGVLPFFHVFAMTTVMLFSLHKAATLIMHPRFVLKDVLRAIAKKKPTLMPGVPTMYAALAHDKKVQRYDLSSLKACISGGAPLPLEIRQRFEQLTGCRLVEGYGLTEASPVVCANPLEGGVTEGTVGFPLPGTEVCIVDQKEPTRVMGHGEIGELCVRGPQVMVGYWQQPDETAATLLEGGWLRTGDMAELAPDGTVRIVDRMKEMIIAGGYNIYPRQVEEVIYQHPAVAEAAVIGVKHAYRGEEVKCFVVAKKGQHLDEKTLLAFLQGRLSAYAMPKHVVFRDALPKTLIGKIDKKALT